MLPSWLHSVQQFKLLISPDTFPFTCPIGAVAVDVVTLHMNPIFIFSEAAPMFVRRVISTACEFIAFVDKWEHAKSRSSYNEKKIQEDKIQMKKKEDVFFYLY